MNWYIVIAAILLIVALDKMSTFFAIKSLNDNFPQVDHLSAEKNPVARYFFSEFGLFKGTAFFFLVTTAFLSIVCLILGHFLSAKSFALFFHLLLLWHGIVIFNNLFYFLKYSNLL